MTSRYSSLSSRRPVPGRRSGRRCSHHAARRRPPDQEALGVRRADPVAELDAGGHDLVARSTFSVESIWLIDQDAAELADDLARRGVRGQLADDGRARVGQQHDLRDRRSDIGHPAGQRAAGRHHDVADRDAVVGAVVEDDQAPESEDSRAMTDAAVVLSSRPARSCRSAVSCSFSRWISWRRAFSLVSRSLSARERGVVAPEPVDLADRGADRGDAAGDLVEAVLDRLEREADARSAGRGRTGSTRTPSAGRVITSRTM